MHQISRSVSSRTMDDGRDDVGLTVWPFTTADSLLIVQNPWELSTGVNAMLYTAFRQQQQDNVRTNGMHVL
jgi:hypothetical protein